MTRILATIALGALAIFCLAASPLSLLNVPTDESPVAPVIPPLGPTEKLTLHEWGTFTGFAGSDGVHIPFGIAVGSELPQFVIDRRTQAQRLGMKINPWGDFGKADGVVALQRMETPVIYFYTDKSRWVNVAVDFPKGLLTEFYPPVRAFGPEFGVGPGEYRYLPTPPLPRVTKPATRPVEAKLDHGSLDWGQVLLLPQVKNQRPTYMPEVQNIPGGGAHYAFARETDAATVQFSDRAGEAHDERFLFYRGLGNFDLPVTLRALDDDRFELKTTGGDAIPFAILLRISPADGRARFAVYTDITDCQPMTLPSDSVSPDQVGDAIVRGLVTEGLYEKEARAMVKTWSSTWLGDAGTRVLYALPRPVTDSLLPLHIAPTPSETVRVLVGRIDIMTPSQETRIASLLASAPQTKSLSADDAAVIRPFAGRFLHPALQRAAQLRGGVPANQREMQALLWHYYNAPKPEAKPAAGNAAADAR